jgi:hypothetical protein
MLRQQNYAKVGRPLDRGRGRGRLDSGERNLVTDVCHDPCSLLRVDLGDSTPLVRGKKLTAFSKKERVRLRP